MPVVFVGVSRITNNDSSLGRGVIAGIVVGRIAGNPLIIPDLRTRTLLEVGFRYTFGHLWTGGKEKSDD